MFMFVHMIAQSTGKESGRQVTAHVKQELYKFGHWVCWKKGKIHPGQETCVLRYTLFFYI